MDVIDHFSSVYGTAVQRTQIRDLPRILLYAEVFCVQCRYWIPEYFSLHFRTRCFLQLLFTKLFSANQQSIICTLISILFLLRFFLIRYHFSFHFLQSPSYTPLNLNYSNEALLLYCTISQIDLSSGDVLKSYLFQFYYLHTNINSSHI